MPCTGPNSAHTCKLTSSYARLFLFVQFEVKSTSTGLLTIFLTHYTENVPGGQHTLDAGRIVHSASKNHLKIPL